MKKTIVSLLLASVIGVGSLGMLAACGSATEQQGDTTQKEDLPVQQAPALTKSEVIAARQRAIESTVQGYDFSLTFTGDFSILGLSASLFGKYDGAYRYDSTTDTVAFRRTTSGPLLFDSTAYVFTSGDSRIKMTMAKDEVKKLSVEIPEEQNITMINLPIVAIVNAVKVPNIRSVDALQNSTYAYSCPLALDAENPTYNVLNQVFEKLGTGVSFKGIELKTDVSTLDFNIKNDRIDDFQFNFQMEVGVKGAKVSLGVEYEQTSSSTPIEIPNTANSGIMYVASDIENEVAKLNASLADLKNDDVYSIDLKAKNEFDPGWNILATTDSYTARMYKNTDTEGNVWFNHSYCYKAHDEEDGRESYKYTIGNVNGKDEENQGVWLISRKSSNTQTKINNVTADSQFDFLTSMVTLDASEIDCLRKQIKNSSTVYTVYLGRAGAEYVQKKIIDMINTNEYDSVIEVNNYFNSENIVKDAEIEIIMTEEKISSIKVKTKLCYTPIGGDYTEYNITLDNDIELIVNKEYEKAAGYEAPTKVKGTLNIGNNLNDRNNYIL